MSQPPPEDGPKRPIGPRPALGPRPAAANDEPGWADGLRKLYNSIIDEPLPDSFDDLLRKLDKDNDD